MTTRTITKTDSGREVTLDVTADGMVLTISAGGFRIGKESFNLPEPTTYTVAPDPKLRSILLYLMRKKSDGKAVVMADEVLEGEMPLQMTENPDYSYLWNLASLRVPADAHDLGDAVLVVIHSKPPAQPTKKG